MYCYNDELTRCIVTFGSLFFFLSQYEISILNVTVNLSFRSGIVRYTSEGEKINKTKPYFVVHNNTEPAKTLRNIVSKYCSKVNNFLIDNNCRRRDNMRRPKILYIVRLRYYYYVLNIIYLPKSRIDYYLLSFFFFSLKY